MGSQQKTYDESLEATGSFEDQVELMYLVDGRAQT